MKSIAVEDAIGTVLCHDITRIVPGVTKEPAFRRGHIIKPQDIKTLLDIGKTKIYVFDPKDGYIHEDECAVRIAKSVSDKKISISRPIEGKSTLKAQTNGILRINLEGLISVNSVTDITLSTIHSNQFVTQGRIVGATRVIPLAVSDKLISSAESICHKYFPIVGIQTLKNASIGIVTTGSEIYNGRIKDGFGPVLTTKFESLGSHILEQVFVSDDATMTANAILNLIKKGADLVAVTGGMSVDPDDQTPAAIRATGADIIAYGAPVYPGAMFMLAYLNNTPIIGLPGCVMYYKSSIFDIVVPRLLTGEHLSKRDIVTLSHGGLCENCDSCHYPKCGFGKSSIF